MEQALPGDGVDWTEADYHATIGQLYAHISMQQKQINVLIQVRNEQQAMLDAAIPADAVAHYETTIAMKNGEIDRLRQLRELVLEQLHPIERMTPEFLEQRNAMAATPTPIHEKQP